MKGVLSCHISHASWREDLNKEYSYEGDTLDDILAQIDTLPYHRKNLKQYKKTRFKDVHGAKHQWKLKIIHDAPSVNRNSLWQEDLKDQKTNTAFKWKSWLRSLIKSPSKS